MTLDAELLQRYVENRDEGAFAELVRQHLGLVYAAALRRTGGRAHLAEEVAQKVFTDLARKAPSLRHHPALSGWLYRSTRYAAIDAIRAEQRRQKLKETLATMSEDDPVENSEAEWERLRPVLDEAMDELKEGDREAMVLRYFEALSFSEVGERLKLSENAARMRTERALEKLRSQLARRGVTSTAAAVGMLLANRAVAAAPEGLAGNVATTALAQTSPAVGVGLVAVISGKLAASAAIALCAVGLGVLGWKLAGAGTTLGGKSADKTLVLAADEFAAHAMAVYQIMAQVHPLGADGPNGATATPHGLDSVGGGQASPKESHLSFAEASRARDVSRLARLLTFDAHGTEVARSIHARMPAQLREELRTPEELFAFFYATDTLLSPVPPAEFLKTFIATEMSPGRMAVHRPGTAPRGLEFVLTDEGWKHEVPTRYLTVLSARILSSETLAKLNALPQMRAVSTIASTSGESGTARAALVAFATACNRGDAPTAAALLHFDFRAREKALAFMASLPPALQEKWGSPEELAADLLVDGAIGNPYPAEPVLTTATEENVGDQRVALLLPGTIRARLEFQQSASGWQYVITEAMVDDYLRRMAAAATKR